MKHLGILVMALSLSLSSVTARAATSDEIRSAIENQIHQRHPNPPPDFWPSLGNGAIPVLKQMYSEAKDGYTRSWLVDGMGHFDDPGITALLKTGVSGTNDDILKRKMLSSLIESQGDAVYDFVEPYLKDSDPHVRQAVARSLREHADSERVQKRLDEFDRTEKLAWVQSKARAGAPERVRSIPRTGENGPRASSTGMSPAPSMTPLPEKDWAGEWKGVYLSPDKNVAAHVVLKKDGTRWKIELKLPKQAKKVWDKDAEVAYERSANAHWIEIRDRKHDTMFIAHKKVAEGKKAAKETKP